MKSNRSLLRAHLVLASLPALILFGQDALAQEPPPAPPAPTGSTAPAPTPPSTAAPAQPPAATAPAQPPAAPPAEATKPAHETNCHDRIDNDGDTVVDCADADCYNAPECKPSGVPENTNSLCSDFIDNDGNGEIDCEDPGCQGPGVTVCRGSYQRGGGAATSQVPEDLPDIGQGLSVEDLIGKGSDKDGERNDELCSDGIDNDGDGRVDCADFGCRFDPGVTVCNGNPGVRFSVVAQVTQSHFWENQANASQPKDDTRFSALQLRALGPIKGLQNSFFLLSMRAEKTPRLTFAQFQIPVGHSGHYFNINSGGGGLSAEAIRSIAKDPLVDPAYYMLSAFEQGNGAAAEFGGPLEPSGTLQFRTFVAGGAGTWTGNVGGRYFKDNNNNYTYAAGAQITTNIVGFYNRFDNPILFVPVPLTVAVALGGKYDRRAVERYPAGNAQAFVRWGRLSMSAETYLKRELEFKSTQVAFNAFVGLLLWPHHFFFAADYGQYRSGNLENPPADLSATGSAVQAQRDEQDARAALHWFFFRNVGVLTALYRWRDVRATRNQKDGWTEKEGRLVGQFWF